ncbi:MAG: biotin-dependent carboxyltransferase family protein [Thermoanaerobaculia bacterium]|nr:biotin-dependent carboxyltransferase family protein [Thermoanaerobaculia bacterium]
MTIEVRRPGLLTTVQDLGRPGFRSSGVPQGGAMDPEAARLANRLVGNPESSAVLEITLEGPELRFFEPRIVAVTGGWFDIRINGEPLPPGRPAAVPDQGILSIRRGTAARCFLAVSGGIDVPVVLDSRSTCLPGGFGGFFGRSLRRGDLLPLGKPRRKRLQNDSEDVSIPHQRPGPVRLRAAGGPQFDAFTPESITLFFSAAFRVTPECDRTGIRLEGPRLVHSRPADIPSEGVLRGAVQVPGSGEAVILGPDQPVTGGYTKIAQILEQDLGQLAYLLPGDTVRFEPRTFPHKHVDIEW